ncbi:hypothetical protein AQI95_10875 [Streptomyces yokosukanensis]|uniref:DUF6879 domain-containing protein n=1 Tax=Streptomyces yokosukanensis TaxID=67386 RepID=A0A117Q4H1_9ACTN|nr:hypothetical protein AQI95_10875 [Streptomyces yokosukanensis]
MLPGSDLWIFEGRQVLLNHRTGAGDWADATVGSRAEPSVVKQCSDAFEALWARGIPHETYETWAPTPPLREREPRPHALHVDGARNDEGRPVITGRPSPPNSKSQSFSIT